MTEAEARAVLLVHAVEAGAETPLWTAEDRAWATRLTQQTLSGEPPRDAAAVGSAGSSAASTAETAAASAERFVVARAGHALQRLLPRDAAARRAFARRGWRALWLLVLACVAFAAGALVDHVGASQRINVLAPPVWLVIAWNLAVYLALLLPLRAAGLPRLLARRWLAGNSSFALQWARHAAPLSMQRATLLLHVGAAALAAGLIAGLYLRGMVLDYRAGWQSTFLDAPLVQTLLNTLLAPASALTGITVPDVAPLRLLPGAVASASAAPWIHLLAAMLLLFVLLPRTLLALLAAWRARRLARHFPLSLAEPYFDKLRLQQQGGRASVQVLPYAAECSAQAALGLRAVLASAFGDEVLLRLAALTPFGADAVQPAEPAADAAREPVPSLRVLLFDLTATPEAEAQGRFIQAHTGRGPLLLVADEAAFQRRHAATPERRVQRRRAWQQLADANGVGLLCVDLDAPDLASAGPALQRLLAS